MNRLWILGLLTITACPSDPPAPPTKTKTPIPSIQPERPVLTIKAPPGQMVQTRDGLWLKAAFGTKKDPIFVKDGPASIAELGFVRAWVDHPPCAEKLEVRSLGLEGGERWIDEVSVRCGDHWSDELYFDLTDVVQRQIESLQAVDDPRVLLGIDSADKGAPPKKP